MVLRGLESALIIRNSRKITVEFPIMDNGFPRCRESNVHPLLTKVERFMKIFD